MLKAVKSFNIKKILEIAVNMKLKDPKIWLAIEEVLVQGTEYETLGDIVDIIEMTKDHEFQNKDFWSRMTTKLMQMKEQWNTRDIIDLVRLISGESKEELAKFVQDHSKVYIA